MKRLFTTVMAFSASVLGSSIGRADLNPVGIWNGQVGLSIDGVGSNNAPVGSIQASIPTGSTILAAYLYSAGTPYPWYSNSPTTLANYNSAGISLAGTTISTFDTLMGSSALPARPELGTWYSARADVTSLVGSLATSGPNYSWAVGEGTLNNLIDGEVLAIVYQNSSLPNGSVVLLDGGQNTNGETTSVNFASPLGNVSDPAFFANMSLGISFSTGGYQHSSVDVNGTRLTTAAGGYNDGGYYDGGLITVGGIGDTIANPTDPNSTSASLDDELYDLKPFLSTGATSMSMFTSNPSDDDNIFFMGLHMSATISQVNDTTVPDGTTTTPLLLLAAGVLAGFRRFGRR